MTVDIPWQCDECEKPFTAYVFIQGCDGDDGCEPACLCAEHTQETLHRNNGLCYEAVAVRTKGTNGD